MVLLKSQLANIQHEGSTCIRTIGLWWGREFVTVLIVSETEPLIFSPEVVQTHIWARPLNCLLLERIWQTVSFYSHTSLCRTSLHGWVRPLVSITPVETPRTRTQQYSWWLGIYIYIFPSLQFRSEMNYKKIMSSKSKNFFLKEDVNNVWLQCSWSSFTSSYRLDSEHCCLQRNG